MSNDTTLNINQMLDAFKIEFLQQQLLHNQIQQKMFSILEDRLFIPKMRSIDTNTNNSTGSSRRSTPTNNIFSNCSSSNSSSPNSPSSLLNIQNQCNAFTNTNNNLSNQFSSDLIINNQSVFNQLNLTLNILKQQINKKPVLQETLSETINASKSNTQTLTQSSSLQSSTCYSNKFHHSFPSSSTISLSVRQSRAAHNELEKNRRANLRNYLDKLKSVLPPDSDSTRDTTLSLLTRARNYLRTIKHEKNMLSEKHKNALTELQQLRQELASLKKAKQNITIKKKTGSKQLIDINDNTKKKQIIKMEKNCKNSTLNILLPSKLLEKKDIEKKSISPINCIDLYMEGLLPAIPLLYPYQEMIIRHSTYSL